jgi:hypothetical protein
MEFPVETSTASRYSASDPVRRATLTDGALFAGPVCLGLSMPMLALWSSPLALMLVLRGAARRDRQLKYLQAFDVLRQAAPIRQALTLLGLTVGLLPNLILHTMTRPRFYRGARKFLHHPPRLLLAYAAGMGMPVLAILTNTIPVSDVTCVLVGACAVGMASILAFALINQSRLVGILHEELDVLAKSAANGELGSALRNRPEDSPLGVLEILSALDRPSFDTIADGLVLLAFLLSVVAVPIVALVAGGALEFLSLAILSL